MPGTAGPIRPNARLELPSLELVTTSVNSVDNSARTSRPGRFEDAHVSRQARVVDFVQSGQIDGKTILMLKDRRN